VAVEQMGKVAEEVKAGRWCMFCAENGWNRTALGVAFYDNKGKLAGSRFRSAENAVARGEIPEFLADFHPDVPQTWDEMDRKLTSTGNAMSVLKWDGGLPTLVWDTKSIDSVFSSQVIGRQ
jgi:hypothetical protein